MRLFVWHRSRIMIPAILLICAAVTIGVIWTAYVLELQREEERSRKAALVRLESVAQALAEQTERTLDSINIATLYLRQSWLAGTGPFESALKSLRPVISPKFELNAVVTDAQGWTVYATFPHGPDPVSYADRDHFRFQIENAGDELFISPPVTGRLSGRPMVPCSRKIVDARGTLIGTVTMPVAPEDLIRIDAHVNLGPHGGVSVVGEDRIIRSSEAKQPGVGIVPSVGSLVPADRPYFTAPQGSFTASGSADGQPRLFAFQRLQKFPFVVVATETTEDVYSGMTLHRQELQGFAILASIGTLLFAMSLAALFAALAQRNRDLTSKSGELERSNADLEQFAYVASHDLREPLRMVSSFMGLLERRLGPDVDGDIKDYLTFARDGAVRMDQMVLDLLEYSRIGRERPPPARVALDDVLAEVCHDLSAAISDKGGSVTVQGRLPAVLGDRGELARLFQNLIGNGLKYAATDRAPRITVSARRDGAMWRIAVADNGIGIDREHFSKIFGVFQRLHTRDKYQGTGIGLAICKKIVEHHGGRIWLESEEGQGTTFLLTLPPATVRDTARRL